MPRDTARSSRDNSHTNPSNRSAAPARSAADRNVRSAAGSSSSSSPPSINTAPSSSAKLGSARNANDASGTASDRERSIQTGREAARSSSPSSPVENRDRVPPIYQRAAGLAASPFGFMRRMAEDMDRLFQDFGLAQSPTLGLPQSSVRDLSRPVSWIPQLETFRRGDKLVVRADLPGMKKEDVQVDVEDGILTISGERCDENEDSRDDYYRSERSYGQFYRSIALPKGVSAESCEASFKDGVLEVSLSAPAGTGSRKIPVR